MVALRVQGQAYCNMEFNLGSQSEKSSLQLLICRAIQPAFTIRIDQRQRRSSGDEGGGEDSLACHLGSAYAH